MCLPFTVRQNYWTQLMVTPEGVLDDCCCNSPLVGLKLGSFLQDKEGREFIYMGDEEC